MVKGGYIEGAQEGDIQVAERRHSRESRDTQGKHVVGMRQAEGGHEGDIRERREIA